jgi:hypothetical protein
VLELFAHGSVDPLLSQSKRLTTIRGGTAGAPVGRL